MRAELLPEESAFRHEWKKEIHAPAALLQVTELPGFQKRAAVFLRLSDCKEYTLFRYFAERAAAVVKRCAIQYSSMPWLAELSNFTASPRFLIDDDGRHAWINVAAGTSRGEYDAASAEAISAAAIWAEEMRATTEPELAAIKLRSRFPSPEYSTRLLSETEEEAIARRLLSQLGGTENE